MKKIIVTVIGFLFINHLSFSQSIERAVIGSTGNFLLSGGYSVSSTTGEAVVQTFTSGSNILTQGFQQPDDKAVGIEDVFSSTTFVKIYPNPTSDLVIVDIRSTGSNTNYAIEVTDVLGRTIQPFSTMQYEQGKTKFTVNLESLSAGIYFLRLFSDENKSENHTYKISKIN